ncbi:MAG: hypothetical protein UV20_C0050G0005 [Candidatus Magasanikbacteria bacterium GW2011_GWA2_42_32]|uniref:Uncharacterized protein n=1 Tax=Candidatus Magasanikbacteria bacterium GW2011_GWA2_42_32 TaxID=1619039 RepID=A0A0G1CV63_9BACT|nr:MAG: hypothetical protein UV20_C0050G0005 [Candidatus Magasanikbacteria bacterium GW2011_GWA2_42_32]
MNWLKGNWFRVGLLTILVISIAGAFYWFQLRPAEIKRACSWVEQQTEAIPEVTQVDIENAKIYFASCKIKYPDAESIYRGYQGVTGVISAAEWKAGRLCADHGTLAKGSPHPAIPSRTYYQEARPEEYNFCLHSRGL